MAYLDIVWLVELVILGLLLANRSMQHTLKLQKQAAALQEENNIARYTAPVSYTHLDVYKRQQAPIVNG